YPVYRGPSAAEIAAQQRYAAAHAQNELGLKAYYSENYAQAIAYYKKALEYTPNDPVIQKNVQWAIASIQSAKGRDYYKYGDYASAHRYFEIAKRRVA